MTTAKDAARALLNGLTDGVTSDGIVDALIDDRGNWHHGRSPEWVRTQRWERSRRAGEAAILSEAALRVDWDRPEEDLAWAHLQERDDPGSATRSTKASACGLLETLPDSSTWDEIAYFFYVRSKVERGLASARTGKGLTNEQVRAKYGLT